MRARRLIVLGLALATAPACRRSAPSAAEETAPAEPAIRFELAGCAAVTRGPICEVTATARTVRLWIASEDAAVQVTCGPSAITPRVTKTEGGQLVTLDAPAGCEGETLTAIAAKGGTRATLRLPVQAGEVDARLARASTLHRGGQLREALETMPDPATLPASLQGRAVGQRARLDLASGHAEDAIRGLRASMAAHRRQGRISDEARDGLALVYALLTHGRRFVEARAVLAELAEPLAGWDEGRAESHYYRALVARDAGDLRAALRELGEAEHAAARLGLAAAHRNARQVGARLLQSLGRTDEARAALQAALAETTAEADPCGHAELVGDLSWVELLEREAPSPGVPPAMDAGELSRLLERTLALFVEHCPRTAKIQNAHVNLALGALQRGDAEGAARHAHAARAPGAPGVEIAVWLLDLEGRIALLRKRPTEALAHYDELAARAHAAYSPEVLWRALLGRGRALAELSRDDDALAAYREAERVLDRQVLAIPIFDGRAGFLGQHGHGAARIAELLVRLKRPGDAALTVRLARARAIASAARIERVGGLGAPARARWDDALARYERERDALDEEARSDWGLSADKLAHAHATRRAREEHAQAALDDAFAALAERAIDPALLAPPREGEVLLVYQAFADDAARGFAVDAAGTVTQPLALPPADATPDELARALLEPFAASIERARRVRILATGPLLRVDFHALPWRGEPLVAHAPVEYPLDLPSTHAAEAPRADARPTALVVADSRNNLTQARREADAVATRLSAAWKVESLVGDAAQRAAVLDGLARAELFHFGGHGIFAGRTGWDSTLALADTGALTLGDVLALPSAPRRVVLSGCETGRSPEGARVVDVSLAGAFVAAGAETVVAAARPVKDELAAALAEALYPGASGRDWDLVATFQQAQLAVRRSMPGADWASYRVITR